MGREMKKYPAGHRKKAWLGGLGKWLCDKNISNNCPHYICIIIQFKYLMKQYAQRPLYTNIWSVILVSISFSYDFVWSVLCMGSWGRNHEYCHICTMQSASPKSKFPQYLPGYSSFHKLYEKTRYVNRFCSFFCHAYCGLYFCVR